MTENTKDSMVSRAGLVLTTISNTSGNQRFPFDSHEHKEREAPQSGTNLAHAPKSSVKGKIKSSARRMQLLSQSRRFESQYIPEPNTGCWLWTGYANSQGYGRTRFDGKTQPAHRVSLALAGVPATAPFVLHSCDTPSCVNPQHLRYGTQQENMDDCKRKNRVAKGAGNPNTKLTARDVVSIRASTDSCPALARAYKVSDTHIRRLRSGVYWESAIGATASPEVEL